MPHSLIVSALVLGLWGSSNAVAAQGRGLAKQIADQVVLLAGGI
jgi:hypothetical protein